jgi:hypothetical protein
MDAYRDHGCFWVEINRDEKSVHRRYMGGATATLALGRNIYRLTV